MVFADAVVGGCRGLNVANGQRTLVSLKVAIKLVEVAGMSRSKVAGEVSADYEALLPVAIIVPLPQRRIHRSAIVVLVAFSLSCSAAVLMPQPSLRPRPTSRSWLTLWVTNGRGRGHGRCRGRGC